MHIFGDAFSPLIVGTVSDAYTKKHGGTGAEVNHLGLLYSFYITLIILCFGSACYFVTAWFLPSDKRKMDELLKEVDSSPPVVRRDGGAGGGGGGGGTTTVVDLGGSFQNTGFTKDV